MTTPPEPITPGILRRLLRQQLYLAALLGIAIWFIFRVRDILPIFLFSFLLAYLLGPLVRRVAGREGKGLSRGAAALIVYLLVIAVLGLVLYILYHALQSDVASYARHYQTYRAALLADLRQQEASGPLRVLPGSAKEALNNLVIDSDAVVSDLARRSLPALLRTVPHLLELIAVPILAYYLLTDYRRFIGFARQMVRPEGRDRFDQLIHEINSSLRGYLAGQATLSLIAGAAAFLILSLNGVRPALVLFSRRQRATWVGVFGRSWGWYG